MGEVNEAMRPGTKQGMSRKSPKVDLTPMVDLGFILITFFIFTTSMSEPKAMKIKLPSDVTTTEPMVTASSKTISIILTGNDGAWVYDGDDPSKMSRMSVDVGVRQALIRHKQQVISRFRDPKEQVVLIKPSQESSYKNVVDMLDEMLINEVSRYVLMEVSDSELSYMQMK